MKDWEEETKTLVKQAEAELRTAERRARSSYQTLENARRTLDSLRATLKYYRRFYGLPAYSESPPVTEAERYRSLSVKEMVLQWTRDHDNRFEVNAASEFLAGAGYFSSKSKASGSLYTSVLRMPKFIRVDRGVFVYSESEEESEDLQAVILPVTFDTESSQVVSGGLTSA